MDDAHALHLTRRIVANLNYTKPQQVRSSAISAPRLILLVLRTFAGTDETIR